VARAPPAKRDLAIAVELVQMMNASMSGPHVSGRSDSADVATPAEGFGVRDQAMGCFVSEGGLEVTLALLASHHGRRRPGELRELREMVETLLELAGEAGLLKHTGHALRQRGPQLDEAIARLGEAGLGEVAAQMAHLRQSVNRGHNASACGEYDHVHVDAVVTVVGLCSRPELNGRRGRVVGRTVHSAASRVNVQIEGEAEPFANELSLFNKLPADGTPTM
jgi:hypothetical protein